MKKIATIIIILGLALGLAGCGNASKAAATTDNVTGNDEVALAEETTATRKECETNQYATETDNTEAEIEKTELQTEPEADTIIFGSYKGESIEWRVLDERDGYIFILSEYALDVLPFNEKWVSATWEECSLRIWLNSTFFDEAFSDDEKSRILLVEVDNSGEPLHGIDSGNDTLDRLFLLSFDEVNEYLQTDEDRACHFTEYARQTFIDIEVEEYYENEQAVIDGFYKYSENEYGHGACQWWLRSRAEYAKNAAIVQLGGALYKYRGMGKEKIICNFQNYDTHTGVRPAMWISK